MSSIKDRGVIGFDLRMEPRSNLASLEKGVKEQRFSDDVPDIWISADPAFLMHHEEVDNILQKKYPYANVMSLWNPMGLANQLPVLISDCHARGVSTDGFLSLAITCSMTNFIALDERFGPEWLDSLPTEEELVSDGWQLLGFDVLDIKHGGLISGLSGCGYKDSTKAAYRQWFGADLNKFGLFQSFSMAQRFAEVRGLEIPEHAPFVVVGVLSTNGE